MEQATSDPELWRTCPGHEGYYEVSNLGRVRSLDRFIVQKDGQERFIPGKVKSLSPGFSGYVLAQLWRNNKQRRVRVHTLVLEAFVGLAPAGMECRHIDGNPSNNHLPNLEWGTSSENKWDRVRHGNHPAKNRVTCPRGHLLAEPNLVPSSAVKGFRNCLACARAHSGHGYARRMGYLFDLQAQADKHYRKIMAAAA